jgi:hypothetical protein
VSVVRRSCVWRFHRRRCCFMWCLVRRRSRGVSCLLGGRPGRGVRSLQGLYSRRRRRRRRPRPVLSSWHHMSLRGEVCARSGVRGRSMPAPQSRVPIARQAEVARNRGRCFAKEGSKRACQHSLPMRPLSLAEGDPRGRREPLRASSANLSLRSAAGE